MRVHELTIPVHYTSTQYLPGYVVTFRVRKNRYKYTTDKMFLRCCWKDIPVYI